MKKLLKSLKNLKCFDGVLEKMLKLCYNLYIKTVGVPRPAAGRALLEQSGRREVLWFFPVFNGGVFIFWSVSGNTDGGMEVLR